MDTQREAIDASPAVFGGRELINRRHPPRHRNRRPPPSKVDALLGDGAATTTSSSSWSLGLTSALQMMETLSTKEERSYERLYNFLTNYLDLHSRSVSNIPTSSSSNPQHGGRGGMLLPPSNQKNRGLIDEDAMDETLRHPFVVRALHVLRHKPSYHAHTLELIAASQEL